MPKKISTLIYTVQCHFRATSKQAPTLNRSPTFGIFICQLAKLTDYCLFPCTEQRHPATSFGAVAYWVLICYSTDFLLITCHNQAGSFFVLCVDFKSISLCDVEGVSHLLAWVMRVLHPLVTD